MRVRVYRNLHKNVWSVQHYITGTGWRLFDHYDEVKLENVYFHVSPAGRKRVLREKKKNVHAYAQGTKVSSFDAEETHDPFKIWYNPYKSGYFQSLTGPIGFVERVEFTSEGYVLGRNRKGSIAEYAKQGQEDTEGIA